MRVGVVGAGRWGPNIIRNLNKLDVQVLVCDSDPARLVDYPNTTTDYQELLNMVDAVCVATPARTHRELAEQALRGGKHVFVEKPLACSVEDAEAIVRAQTDKVFMVGHTFLYDPLIRAAHNAGRVVGIVSHRLNTSPVEGTTVLWDLGPHDVSIALYLMGEPKSVHHSSGYLSLDFDGPRADAFLSWSAPRKVRDIAIRGVGWEMNVSNYVPPVEPLELELRDFVHCITTGTARDDGEFALRVVRVLEEAQ